jgi:uncharacterized protein YjiS (DUF1127 family)
MRYRGVIAVSSQAATLAARQGRNRPYVSDNSWEFAMATNSAPLRVGIPVTSDFVGPLWKRLLDQIAVWRQRISSRRELANMSELERRDIGYPAELDAEMRKPFWQP